MCLETEPTGKVVCIKVAAEQPHVINNDTVHLTCSTVCTSTHEHTDSFTYINISRTTNMDNCFLFKVL